MLKKILPLMFVLLTTVIASVAGLAMEARNFYLPDKEEENVSVEYYCTEKNEIIVVFGKEQLDNFVFASKLFQKIRQQR